MKNDSHIVENKEDKKMYVKHQSFDSFLSNLNTDLDFQFKRVIARLEKDILEMKVAQFQEVLSSALRMLKDKDGEHPFKITLPIADELSRLTDDNISRYVYHRYRYDVFPKERKLDSYPPYLQIEPTSICNYRCVFCYQTDKSFTDKNSGHMGHMSFDLFKEIIDQAEGNIEFFSLASRGEPLICRDIEQMLRYCEGKFLGLKMNTNASLLTESKCHAILAGGVNTLVFSADAAKEPLYSQMRVNGKLEKVLKNIEMFNRIREKDYPNSNLITRVSGVKFKDEQSMESMSEVWGPIVDQVCFVDYNPWENVYDSKVNSLTKPCSDLWRRMFIWFDGKTNPCDTDYKSTLSVGSHAENSISELWRSNGYEKLRSVHLNQLRSMQEPCRRCTVV